MKIGLRHSRPISVRHVYDCFGVAFNREWYRSRCMRYSIRSYYREHASSSTHSKCWLLGHCYLNTFSNLWR